MAVAEALMKAGCQVYVPLFAAHSGVYSPHLDQVFLVPLEGLPSRLCHLRLHPARNGQEQGVRWAADYLVRPLPPTADGIDQWS